MTKGLKTKNWVDGHSAVVLNEINSREINIAIFNREIDSLSKEIEVLGNHSIEVRVSGEPVNIIQALNKEIGQYRLLIEDISLLLHLFKDISGCNSFRLLLATVNTNMCRKFHTDIIDLRLLCTYSGPGTLWLPDDNVNQNALDTCGDNECVVLDESRVQQVETGSVVILKGALYPAEGTRAIVHRSPTIEEYGEKRLLLRIDTNEFLNFE